MQRCVGDWPDFACSDYKDLIKSSQTHSNPYCNLLHYPQWVVGLQKPGRCSATWQATQELLPGHASLHVCVIHSLCHAASLLQHILVCEAGPRLPQSGKYDCILSCHFLVSVGLQPTKNRVFFLKKRGRNSYKGKEVHGVRK